MTSVHWRRVKRHWQLYLVVALPLAFLIIFNYVPMIGAQLAFRDYNPRLGFWHSPWIGVKAFRLFFESPYFWMVIRNSLRINLYSLVIGTPFVIILALALNELRNGLYKKSVQMVTYIPYFISTVVLVGLMEIVLSPNIGLLGHALKSFGMEYPPDWMSSPTAFPSLYVWSGIWQEAGYGAIIYLAALSSVNPELYEAAKIDGASRPQKIRYIDLPSIMPTIVILFILSVGGLMNIGFEKVFLLQNSMNLGASEVISTYVYKVGLLEANFSFSVAVGLFNSLIGLVLILFVNLVSRKVSQISLF